MVEKTNVNLNPVAKGRSHLQGTVCGSLERQNDVYCSLDMPTYT